MAEINLDNIDDVVQKRIDECFARSKLAAEEITKRRKEEAAKIRESLVAKTVVREKKPYQDSPQTEDSGKRFHDARSMGNNEALDGMVGTISRADFRKIVIKYGFRPEECADGTVKAYDYDNKCRNQRNELVPMFIGSLEKGIASVAMMYKADETGMSGSYYPKPAAFILLGKVSELENTIYRLSLSRDAEIEKYVEQRKARRKSKRQ